MIDIRTLRAAGLSDAQILRVIEEDQAKARELNRIRKKNQRSRHADGRDGGGHVTRTDVTMGDKIPPVVEPQTTDPPHVVLEVALTSEHETPPAYTKTPPLKKEPKKVLSFRGTRLPENWEPDDDGRAYAAKLGLDCQAILADFRDYWHARAGPGAIKMDWNATWRTWCRRENEKRGNGNGSLHVRASRQQTKPNPLAEAFAEVRTWVRDRESRSADVVVSNGRLPQPERLRRDDGEHSGGLPTGDRGLRDGPEDGHPAPKQVAADTVRSGGGVRRRDRVADEGAPELKLIASPATPKPEG